MFGFQRKIPALTFWFQTRGTRTAISIQIKFSRDYLMTNKDMAQFRRQLSAAGWWTPTRKAIEESRADYWIFVLVGFGNRSTDFVIIKPDDLFKRVHAIHAATTEKVHIYFWITNRRKCWDARNLKNSDRVSIADGSFENDHRDFTAYLNNWERLKALNGLCTSVRSIQIWCTKRERVISCSWLRMSRG